MKEIIETTKNHFKSNKENIFIKNFYGSFFNPFLFLFNITYIRKYLMLWIIFSPRKLDAQEKHKQVNVLQLSALTHLEI